MSKLKALREAWEAIPADSPPPVVPREVGIWLQPLINAVTAIVSPVKAEVSSFKNLPDLPAGVYRHWKGPLYHVLGYGHDANSDLDRAVVIYIGLQLQGAHTGPRLAARTAMSDDPDVDAFYDFVHPVEHVFQDVTIKAGSKCQHYDRGCLYRVRRFAYLAPGTSTTHIREALMSAPMEAK